MKNFNKFVIILFSVFVTEVITKSFNTKTDKLKLFLLQNGMFRENIISSKPTISGKSLSTIFGLKSYPSISSSSILKETGRQLPKNYKLLDNFYLASNYKNFKNRDITATEAINEILMEKYNENKLNSNLNQKFYPNDYKKKFLSFGKYPTLNTNLLDKMKSINWNIIWPQIIHHNKIIDKRSSRQTTFIPSVNVGESYGALDNLGYFFNNLKNNIDFMEKSDFTANQHQLLNGDLPINGLRRELVSHTLNIERPAGNGDFLHTVRNYQPSQRIRALVSMTPEGYHGSNFIDPNYMWLGLG